MAAGTDILLGFYKVDTLSQLLVAPCFLNTTGSDLRLSGKSVSGNRSNCLQSAHQMTGIDLCDCVDFLLSSSSPKSKQSLKSYTRSAATKPHL